MVRKKVKTLDDDKFYKMLDAVSKALGEFVRDGGEPMLILGLLSSLEYQYNDIFKQSAVNSQIAQQNKGMFG